MKKLMTVGLFSALFLAGFWAEREISPQRVHAQQPSPTPEKIKVNQHWRVKAGVMPDDLQKALEDLNAEGIAVDQTEIRRNDGKYDVIACLCDSDDSEDEGK